LSLFKTFFSFHPEQSIGTDFKNFIKKNIHGNIIINIFLRIRTDYSHKIFPIVLSSYIFSLELSYKHKNKKTVWLLIHIKEKKTLQFLQKLPENFLGYKYYNKTVL
jgi:hypothetical protein